jgi:transketolase
MKLNQKELKKRILGISHRRHLSHLGSCLTALPIICEIYQQKEHYEKFVLSQGHAGLALYVVLEAMYGIDAEVMLEKMGIHPDMPTDPYGYIDCSTGSLGHGVPIALGMAMAMPQETVYCLTSDGELAEGSVYEAANIMRKYKVKNLKVFVNWNGYGGYDRSIARKDHFNDVFKIVDTSKDLKKFSFLDGLKGHYATMSKEEYEDTISRI